MTPFERDIIIPTLRRLGLCHALTLAVELGKAERTARYYLARLEAKGIVERPNGPRKGWTVSDLRLQQIQGRI